MTYQKLFYLKFKKGISTRELAERFPDQIGRVNEVAMLDIPEETLKKVVLEEDSLKRLIKLKKRFSRFL